MITPSFKLTQDDAFLTVTIRAPYTNVRNAEVVYDERSFVFASKPYFLRLFLTGEVVDDESGTSDYDAEGGVFTIRVPKRNKGEYFPNLEMLSELLRPQKNFPTQVDARRLVEELSPPPPIAATAGQSTSSSGDPNASALTENGDELFFNQKLNENDDDGENGVDEICAEFGYGFGWRRSGVLGKFRDEIGDLLDLEECERTPISQRAHLCRQFDEAKFDVEYYLADVFEPDEYLFAECMAFRLDTTTHLALGDADRERLKNVRVHKLPAGVEGRAVARSLLDMLAAYLYDLRATGGEHCVESGWTVAKLAPSLAFLARWRDAEEALVGFLRRAMVFPLIRNWEFAMRVVDDLQTTLDEGRCAILKCLLDIQRIFNSSGGGELRYLLNQLFVDDYILWIQCVEDEILDALRAEVRRARHALTKASVGLDLPLVEMEARAALLSLDDGGAIEGKASEKIGAAGREEIASEPEIAPGRKGETPLDSDDDSDHEGDSVGGDLRPTELVD